MTYRLAKRTAGALAAAVLTVSLAACGGGGMRAGTVPSTAADATGAAPPAMSSAVRIPASMRGLDADLERSGQEREDGGAVLPGLRKQTTIGSTVDPVNGDQNPYGLDIAKADAGLLHRGDLVICNFNDAANVQGNGTTIVALRPRAGATPIRIAQNAALLGCNALALGPTDNIWNAAFGCG